MGQSNFRSIFRLHGMFLEMTSSHTFIVESNDAIIGVASGCACAEEYYREYEKEFVTKVAKVIFFCLD